MPRALTSGMITQVQAESSEAVFLMQFEFGGGTERISTGPTDITWNGFTWQGIGGVVTFSSIDETTDEKGQGVEMRLSGVDTTIVALIMGQTYIGRKVWVWKAYFTNGAIVADPAIFFVGVMNAGFEIEEAVDAKPPTVTITSRIVSRLALLAQERGFRTNLQSHQRVHPGDTFFQNIPAILLTPIYWGVEYPPGYLVRR